MRPRTALALIALVAAGAIGLALALSSGGSRTERRTERASDFGADVGVLFQNRYPRGVLERALSSAADAGLGVARVAPLWERTEPSPPVRGHHRYDWRYDDRIAGELARHGFRWVAILAFSPGWDSRNPAVLHSPPRGTAGFAQYAAALARRYRGRIAAYEIWNEENTRYFWPPAPDPASYARLYLAARSAIHRSDPGPPVLIGGLAGGHWPFFRSLFGQPDLRGRVDAVAIHAYGPNPARVVAATRVVREHLRSLGFGEVPLYVTEYGWSSRPAAGGSRVPASVRATYAPAPLRGGFIIRAAQGLLGSGCDVRMALFYAWVTQEHDPRAFAQWYGVASPNGGPTSTTEAIGHAAAHVAHPQARTARAC